MSPLQEQLKKLLRSQTDSVNLIETMWQFYAHYVKIRPGTAMWTVSRRCFFAGARTFFEAQMLIMEDHPEPTANDLRWMENINHELDRAVTDIMEGRG